MAQVISGFLNNLMFMELLLLLELLRMNKIKEKQFKIYLEFLSLHSTSDLQSE